MIQWHMAQDNYVPEYPEGTTCVSGIVPTVIGALMSMAAAPPAG